LFILTITYRNLSIVNVKDFCSPNGLSAKKGRGLTNFQSMLPQLHKFQQNVKNLGVLSIFTRFIHRSEQNTPANLNILIEESNLSPVCKEGSEGAELYYLIPSPDDLIIDKQYYDCFAGTNLLEILKKIKLILF
jgi:ureidoacrylate peracid hydrolase